MGGAASRVVPPHGRRPRFETDALASLDSLYRTALRLTPRAADAEDLVQDTYLKAFRAADQLRAGHQPEGLAVHHPPQHGANRVRDRARDTVDVDSEAVEQAADGAAPFRAPAAASRRPRRCCSATR